MKAYNVAPKLRIALSLALSLMMAWTAGCAVQADSPAAEQPASGQQEISMMLVMYNKEAPSDLLEQELEKKTGTRLTLNWIPDSVYSDKQLAAFAAGNLPHVIQVKSVDLKKTTVTNGVRSGLFWEIGPYLKDYPNISKYMNPKIMENGSYFGKIYGLYGELPMSRQGIQFRKDWLDKLGLPVPRSIDELYEVLKAFTYNDPDGNGKQDTYGLVDRNDLVYGAFKNIASYFGAPNNWGWVDGRLIPDFMTPEYRNAMDFMKRLYEEKLMNEDFSLISKTQQEERFLAGQAGMMISNLLAYNVNERLQKKEPKASVDVINRVQGPKGEFVWGGTGMGSLYMFPKTRVKTEEELRGILQFYDRLLEADINNLITYGLEGRHYKLSDDGTVKVKPDTKELRQMEVDPYNTAFRTFDVRFLYQDGQNELIMKINRLIEDNESMVVNDPTARLISATQAEKGDELQSIITDATYRYILGTLDAGGFAGELEKWRVRGGDRVIAEMNEAYVKE